MTPRPATQRPEKSDISEDGLIWVWQDEDPYQVTGWGLTPADFYIKVHFGQMFAPSWLPYSDIPVGR